MLPNWLSIAWQARKAARADAEALLRDYGDAAYRIARDRAREARNNLTIEADHDQFHWDRVRRRLSRQLRPERTDTATRMLDDVR